MRGGLRVFDSDMHVFEPTDLYERYLPPGYSGPVPEFVGDPENLRWFGWEIGDRFVGRPLERDHPHSRVTADSDPRYEHYIAEGFSPKAQIRAMDEEGIDFAAIYPTAAGGMKDDDRMDPRHALALSAAANDWLLDFCDVAPTRMRPIALVPLQDVGLAIEELRRAVDRGALGMAAPNRPVLGRPWYHPDYDPLWAACEELDVPVCFHGFGGRHDVDVSERFLNKHQAMYKIVSHTTDITLTVLEMILGGVFVKFPGLRAGYLEAFSGWAPWWVWRMDEAAELYGDEPGFPSLEHPPSWYFQNHCFLSFESEEPDVDGYLASMGSGSLIVSTDFPHHDSEFPHAIDNFLKLDLDGADKEAILWNNCQRLYGLK